MHTYLNVGSKAALIADVAGIDAVLVLDDCLEMVVDLAAHAHGLAEGRRANGKNHKLLHRKTVASMRAAVDHVEGLFSGLSTKHDTNLFENVI